MRIATLLETPLAGWPDGVDVAHARSLTHLASILPGCDAALVDPDAAGGAWLRRARRFAGAVPVLEHASDEPLVHTLGRLQDAVSAAPADVPSTLLVVSAAPYEVLEVRHPDALWIATTRPAPHGECIDATQVPFQPAPRTVSPMQLETLVFRTMDAAKESNARMVVLDDLLALSTLHTTADLIRFINYLAHCLGEVGAGLEVGVRPDLVGQLRGHVHGDVLVADGDALPLPDEAPSSDASVAPATASRGVALMPR